MHISQAVSLDFQQQATTQAQVALCNGAQSSSCPVAAFLAVFQQPGVIWLCPFDSALVCPEPIWTISVPLSPAVESRPSLCAPAWCWCGCSCGWCVFLQQGTRPCSCTCLCWRCYRNTCFASRCSQDLNIVSCLWSKPASHSPFACFSPYTSVRERSKNMLCNELSWFGTSCSSANFCSHPHLGKELCYNMIKLSSFSNRSDQDRWWNQKPLFRGWQIFPTYCKAAFEISFHCLLLVGRAFG